MAVVPLVLTKKHRGVYEVKWEGLANGDTGAPFEVDRGAVVLPDKTVHAKGTFGVGGTVVIEGGNDNLSYVTMTDIHANAASYQAESLDVLSENPAFLRPRVSAGDGDTDLDIIIMCHGVRPTR
jgi:hypothetical protein